MCANKAGIDKGAKEDDSEKAKEFKEAFNKEKVSGKIETEFKQGITAMLSKLSNESNQTIELANLKEYKEYCSQHKRIGCWNCWIGQRICKKLSMKSRYYK